MTDYEAYEAEIASLKAENERLRDEYVRDTAKLLAQVLSLFSELRTVQEGALEAREP